MKKMILLAAIASITLASCVKNEMEVVDNDDQEITFQTVTGNTGRAAIIGSNYPVDASFGTWARYTSVDWDYGVPSQEYITNKKVTFQTPNWKVDGLIYYWPKNGKLSFFSYSPFEANGGMDYIDASGIIATDYTVLDAADEDFMIADVMKNQTGNVDTDKVLYDGVKTVFRHKLTKIGFSLKTDIESARATIVVKKVEIMGVNNKGTYVQKDDIWTLASSPASIADYTAYDNSTGITLTDSYQNTNGSEEKKDLMLLPQTKSQMGDDALIKISYTLTLKNDGSDVVENVVVTTKLNGTSFPDWSMNKHITYQITIGLDEVLWDPNVNDWDSESTPGITI